MSPPQAAKPVLVICLSVQVSQGQGQPCLRCYMLWWCCLGFPRQTGDGGSGPVQIPSAGPWKRNGADRYLNEAELREMIINVDGQAEE